LQAELRGGKEYIVKGFHGFADANGNGVKEGVVGDNRPQHHGQHCRGLRDTELDFGS